MAKGKYYPPEFKEQAVTMVAGLDGTYDLLHAVQGQPFRLDAHPDRSRSASPRRGQTPGMTAAGSRPSRTGRVAAPVPRLTWEMIGVGAIGCVHRLDAWASACWLMLYFSGRSGALDSGWACLAW